MLTGAQGGYEESQADVPTGQLESERTEGQAKLVLLSSDSKQIFVRSGHNMELESPKAVIAAIREMVKAVESHRKLKPIP